MYRIDTIDTDDRFRSLEPVWNSLLASSDLDLPFLSFEWLSSFWEAYGGNHNLAVLQVRDNDGIVALAPFMSVRTTLFGLPVKAVSFLDKYNAGRMGIILKKQDPAIVRLILKSLFGPPRGHDVFVLHGIEKGTATECLLREVIAADCLGCREIPGPFSPYIPIEGNWEEYLKQRSRNFRHKLNRISNFIAKSGAHEVVRYTTDGLDRAMDDIVAISRNTWKSRTNTAIVSSDENLAFYQKLVRRTGARGWLSIWLLYFEGRPIAFQLALDYRRKIHGLKIGFDENFANYSPSRFLKKHIVKFCFDNRYREFDLLGVNDPYKMEWTGALREHVKLMVFNRTAYGRALHLMGTKIMPGIRRFIPERQETREEAVG